MELRVYESGNQVKFGEKLYTLLHEQFPAVWMACETNNISAHPRLLLEKDLGF